MGTVESFAADWVQLIGPALIQNTLFLGLLLLLLHFLRGASAGLRHTLAALGLLKLLLPPFLTLPIPAAPAIGEAASFGLNWLPSQPPAGVESAGAISLPALLFLLWLAGALFSLALPLLGTLRLAGRLRGARPVPESALVGLDLPEGLRVYASAGLSLPLTLGLFPRRIFVPEDWERWTPHCRGLFLRHEAAHLQRRDGAVQLVELVARSLWFFHPLAHLLGRRMHEYREMACDDHSLAAEREAAPAYARYLVEAAETSLRTSGTVETASALMRRKRVLLKRVEYQMKGGSMLSISRWKTGGALAALALMFLALSWALPGGEAVAGKKGKGTIKEKQALAMKGEKGIEVILLGDGRIDMNGESVDLIAFNKAVMGYGNEKGEGPLITIRCADELPMGELFSFQSFLSEKKLGRVRYVGAGKEGIPYKLPGKGLEEKLVKIADEHKLTLFVNAEGHVFLGEKQVKGKKLSQLIERRIAKDPKTVLIIQTDESTPYLAFLENFEMAKKAGASRVAIAPPKRVKKLAG